MHFTPCLDVLESRPERAGQLGGRVPSNRKARTHLGPVGGERGDDDRAAGRDRASQCPGVPVPALGVDEEVEHRSVVPEVVAAVRLPLEQISADAPHGCVGGKPSSGGLERHAGEVEHRDVGEAAADELVREKRASAAHVEHGRFGMKRERLDQVE